MSATSDKRPRPNRPASPDRKSVLALLDALMLRPQERLLPQQIVFRNEYSGKLPNEYISGYGYLTGHHPAIENSRDGAIVFYADSDEHARIIKERIPATISIPTGGRDQFTEVKTSVYSVGNLLASAYTDRARPCYPGYSVSHKDMPAGTIGLIVSISDDANHPYILSCNHVLVKHLQFKKGDQIIQPGSTDSKELNVIAQLHDHIEIVPKDNDFDNISDAAIARVINKGDVDNMFQNMGIVTNISDRILRKMNVHKIGRTSGFTSGQVVDANARLGIRFQVRENSTVKVGFRDVVLCTSFTRPGDSGAAVLNQSNQAIGLVMAGTPSATAFCRIMPIFNVLKLRLWRNGE